MMISCPTRWLRAPSSLITASSHAWAKAAWAQFIWPRTRGWAARGSEGAAGRIWPRDPERMQRFLQEARLASALTHPNVAHIYEIGEDQGLRFLAMEYVEGEPLSVRLGRGPLAFSESALGWNPGRRRAG